MTASGLIWPAFWGEMKTVLLCQPPLLKNLAEDPIPERKTDRRSLDAGLYQVGSFPALFPLGGMEW